MTERETLLQILTGTKHQLRVIIAIQRWLLRKKIPFANGLARWLSSITYLICGCEFAPTAVVPRSTRFPHPTGIVVGAGVQLGERVTLYQNVTLGSHGRPDLEQAYPRIGDDVTIYAGAVVLGGVAIGDRSVVGANTVVSQDVPPDSIVLAPKPSVRQRTSE